MPIRPKSRWLAWQAPQAVSVRLPFPTANNEIVFVCIVIWRGTPLNCPVTFPSSKQTSNKKNIAPSPHSIMEEYVLSMSRLDDISDLKTHLHQLTGIPFHRLKLFLVDKAVQPTNQNNDKNHNNNNNTHSKNTQNNNQYYSNKHREDVDLSSLQEKQGPCFQFCGTNNDKLQGNNNNNNSNKVENKQSQPTRILVYESTLVPCHFRSSGSGGANGNSVLEGYGEPNVECWKEDTDPVTVAKEVSCSLWPTKSSEFTLGLQVDAVDSRKHWYTGSVVEIMGRFRWRCFLGRFARIVAIDPQH